MSAKSGNTNALKHGLYAKRFSADQVKDLKHMPLDDLRQEMVMLRVVIDNIFKITLTSYEDETARAKMYTSLANAVTTLNNTIRTHAILTGNYSPLDDALAAALDAEPFFNMTSEKAEENDNG